MRFQATDSVLLQKEKLMSASQVVRSFVAACAGIMLLMASSAQAVLITPTVSSFSSEDPAGLDRAADYTRDSSGLTGTGAAGSTHNNTATGFMWTTAGNFVPPGTDFDPFITFDLGAVFGVDTMRIWNYNESGLPQLGIATMEVFAGPTLATMTSKGVFALNQATGANGYTGQDVAVFFNARFIQFDILTNYDGAVFDGTGATPGVDGRSLTGLSEVRFEGGAPFTIPEPTTFVLLNVGLVGLGLSRRRRRRA